MKIIISERQFKRLIKNKSLITENFLDKVKLILSRIKKKKDGGLINKQHKKHKQHKQHRRQTNQM